MGRFSFFLFFIYWIAWVLYQFWILSSYLMYDLQILHLLVGCLFILLMVSVADNLPLSKSSGKEVCLEVWACKVEVTLWVPWYSVSQASNRPCAFGPLQRGGHMMSSTTLIRSLTFSWHYRHVGGWMSLWFTKCWWVKGGPCFGHKDFKTDLEVRAGGLFL